MLSGEIYGSIPAPTVTAISPATGTTLGGTSVNITGTDFTGATAVTIGGTAATNITVVSATSITATTPAGTAGTASVLVTTPGGTNAANTLYTYASPAPTVSAISPATGTTAGGTGVTITGTNFTGATAVTIGGTAATNVTVVSATSITATTPAGTAGTASVLVTTPGGTNAANTLYTYAQAAQTIAFTSTAPTNVVVGSASYTVAAKGGASGNPVTFSIDAASTSGACSISGATVSFTAVGSCIIDANQAGNASYLAAPQTQQTITVGLQPTTTTVSASQPTAMIGQPITFTATVMTALPPSAGSTASARAASGAAAAPTPVVSGSVTFTNGSATLCSAVPLNASGQAACTTTFRSAGATSVTATFSGSGSAASSSSVASAMSSPTVTDQVGKTSQIIGKFLGQRNNQILSNAPDASRQIDRLKEAGGQPDDVSSGLSEDEGPRGAATTQRLGDAGAAASVLTRRFGSAGLGASLTERPIASAIGSHAAGDAEGGSNDPSVLFGQPKRSDYEIAHDPSTPFAGIPIAMNGAVRLNGNFFGDATSLQFSTSLRDITRYVESERAKSDSGLALATGRATPNATRANPWDIWVEGKYASFRDTSGAGNDGKFGLVTVGTDYVFNPRLLAGVMVQFDQTKQTSATEQSSVEGNGWMAGPYGTVRLSENLFWLGRAAWGTSSNSISPFLTYTDKFSSTRWLLASTLEGRWDAGPWSFRPAASISYMQDTAQSYVDTFGILMPEVKNALGQAKIGPKISYKWRVSDDLIVQPKAGLQLIWNFAGSSTANGFAIDGNAAGPQGARGRGELGVGLVHGSGIMLDLSGSYDGIGSSGYSATTGMVLVRVPLN